LSCFGSPAWARSFVFTDIGFSGCCDQFVTGLAGSYRDASNRHERFTLVNAPKASAAFGTSLAAANASGVLAHADQGGRCPP
jgi:hypothetical protein